MADIALFNLTADGKYRLAYDRHQWIVQKRIGKSTARDDGYRGVKFIGGPKSGLWRSYAQLGIAPDDLLPDAFDAIDAMPGSFLTWLWQHDADLWEKTGLGQAIRRVGKPERPLRERDHRLEAA